MATKTTQKVNGTDSSVSEESNQNADPLHQERELIREALGRIEIWGFLTEAERKKNAKDSVEYRKKGNDIFKNNVHDADKHQRILELYTQSIALAPNNSEELAFGYGNRSALLLHLKKYQECLKDCDQALNITSSSVLIIKLLCRKAECLESLKDSSLALTICDDALDLISQLEMDAVIKNEYTKKLNNIKTSLSNNFEYNKSKITEECEELPNFIRQKEAPCASEAVAIRYNEEWGRHIVATRRIEPGEIIAIEKPYYTFIYPNGMYLYCSHCAQLAWSSIPCKHCIYGIYCSEKCKNDAWKQYHKFECQIYPYLWDIDKDIKASTASLRFLFMAVHDVGGIKEMEKEIVEIAKNNDARTKGFSDGIFHSNKFRSMFSLQHCLNELDIITRNQMANTAAIALYLLARKSSFFGQRNVLYAIDLLLMKDTWFIGALLLRIFCMIPRNSLSFMVHHEVDKIQSFGIIGSPFCSLFNHSCAPNVQVFKTKNNEVFVYAKHPIEEGQQLFRTYFEDFLDEPKKARQEKLLEFHFFECNCLPCKENWSHICLPNVEDAVGIEESRKIMQDLILEKSVEKVFDDMLCLKSRYQPELIEELSEILKWYAEKSLVYTEDYEHFEEYMHRVYYRSFGSWHIIPDSCNSIQ